MNGCGTETGTGGGRCTGNGIATGTEGEGDEVTRITNISKRREAKGEVKR